MNKSNKNSQPINEFTEEQLIRTPGLTRRRRGIVLIFSGGAAFCLVLYSIWKIGIIPGIHFHQQLSPLAGPIYVPVPEIITNLSGRDGEEPYVKLKVTIETRQVTDEKIIRRNMPRFIDMFESYLRTMHPGELQGASGTYHLREALLDRAYVIAGPARIDNILFEELIVQ